MKTDMSLRVKFSLRIPEKLKREIRVQSAKDNAHSMNEWIVKTLQDALARANESKQKGQKKMKIETEDGIEEITNHDDAIDFLNDNNWDLNLIPEEKQK